MDYYALAATLLMMSLAVGAAEQPLPVRVVVTGNLNGYIRECRCPDGSPGGLARRKTAFDRIRAATPGAIFIDCGEVLRPGMSEAEVRLADELYQSLPYHFVWARTASARLPLPPGDAPKAQPQWVGPPPAAMVTVDQGLTLMVAAEPDTGAEADWAAVWKVQPAIDLLIVGGGGYVQANVEKVGAGRVARPGLNGGEILVIDLFTDGRGAVERCEWQVIPTESVAPDSTFQAIIERVYGGRHP